jgi:hypothetical protein
MASCGRLLIGRNSHSLFNPASPQAGPISAPHHSHPPAARASGAPCAPAPAKDAGSSHTPGNPKTARLRSPPRSGTCAGSASAAATRVDQKVVRVPYTPARPTHLEKNGRANPDTRSPKTDSSNSQSATPCAARTAKIGLRLQNRNLRTQVGQAFSLPTKATPLLLIFGASRTNRR